MAMAMRPTPASADEITNSVGTQLHLLAAGRFEMGDRDQGPGFYKDHSEFNTADDERPVHPVVLTKPFYLAATEVTVGQFRQFVEATGYKTSAEKNARGAVGWDPTPPDDNPRFVATFRDDGDFSWKNPGFEQADNHPVVGVSFADANAYCDWLSKKEGAAYRLPTEAEWEYAARAGTTTYFSFGNTYRGQIQRFANIGNVELEKAFPDRVRRQWLVDIDRDPADKHIFTAPVGRYEASPWGLFDMYGNVWEWCEDRYLDTAYTPYKRDGHQQVRKRAIDPLNNEKGSNDGDWRVIRGGSWFNSPVQCRSGVRGYFEASDAACYLGFRIARDAPQAAVAAARQRFEKAEAARETLQRLADQFRERRDGRLTIELNQQRRPLTDEFFTALESLDEPVDIYLNGPVTAAQLAALAKTRQLTGLVLSNVGPDVTDADFAPLADHAELELLQIAEAPNLSDALFQHLRKLQRLELLRLDAAAITDEGLAALPQLERLETLELRATASQGGILRRFAKSPLRKFSCNHFTDEGAQLLAQFPELQDVQIAGSPITGRGLRVIAQLPRVNRLNLSDCKALTDSDIAVVGDLYELTSLSLDGTAAGDEAAAGIARLNYLRDLHIGSVHLSDAGLRKLCTLVSLHNLTLADEAENVTDAGLVDLWRLANLRGLYIAAPNISGSGLATLPELPYLERLDLNGMGLADVALKHAAASATLRNMFIGSWERGGPPNLTDAGLLHLGDSRSLTQVDLRRGNTKVTDEGLEQLRAKRSELKVNIR